MVKYGCERCGKEFSQKSHYDSHKRRKTPCVNNADKIKQLVDKAVEEKMKKLNYKIFESTKTKLNTLDLFCGCGGMCKGLEDAGLNIIAGIDIWDKAIASYKKNFNHLAICTDLTKMLPSQLESIHNIKKDMVDIIVGGPPCQGFSMAGKRDIKDPRNSLFMEFVKYLDYFEPRAFIMENVMGIFIDEKY